MKVKVTREAGAVQDIPLSRQMLEAALMQIAEDRDLSSFNAAGYKDLGTIEGIAHELAHVLDLGPAFEDLLEAMEDSRSNQHEAAVLRIERGALAALGVRLSMRRLRASANWNDAVGIPSLAQLQTPLNRHERRCAERFVALIHNEASCK